MEEREHVTTLGAGLDPLLIAAAALLPSAVGVEEVQLKVIAVILAGAIAAAAAAAAAAALSGGRAKDEADERAAAAAVGR